MAEDWNPSVRELAEVWTALDALRRAGVGVRFDETVPIDPRDFVRLFNLHQAYVYIDNSYVQDLLTSIQIAKGLPSHDDDSWQKNVQSCIAKIESLDELDTRSKAERTTILAHLRRLFSKAGPKLLRGLVETTLTIVVGVVSGCTLVILALDFFPESTGWVFSAFLAVYVVFGKWTINTALNPAGQMWAAEVSDWQNRREGRLSLGIVHLAVIPLSAFVGAFCALSMALERYRPVLFIGVQGDGPVQWALYTADNLFRTFGLDTAEIFKLDISPIEHSGEFLVSLYVWSFRVTISVFGVSYLVRTLKRYS